MKAFVRHAILIMPILTAIIAAVLIAHAGSPDHAGNRAAAPRGASMSIPF